MNTRDLAGNARDVTTSISYTKKTQRQILGLASARRDSFKQDLGLGAFLKLTRKSSTTKAAAEELRSHTTLDLINFIINTVSPSLLPRALNPAYSVTSSWALRSGAKSSKTLRAARHSPTCACSTSTTTTAWLANTSKNRLLMPPGTNPPSQKCSTRSQPLR